MPSVEQTYAFQNALVVQRARLQALEALLDPGTIRQLEALPVERGWSCLEVGAGGGSIAAWLCERVGPAGAVVATDLDVTVLSELSRPNLEVHRHDLLADDPPGGPFDLVHCRLVIAWLADPRAGLQRLVASLKPGGWLLAEEMDFVSMVPDPRVDEDGRRAFEHAVLAHNATLSQRHAFDHAYGRRLAGELALAGLSDIACEGRAEVWRGGEAGGTVWRLTMTQLRDEMVATGFASEADLDRAVALCDDPAFGYVSPLVFAGRGRRPAS